MDPITCVRQSRGSHFSVFWIPFFGVEVSWIPFFSGNEFIILNYFQGPTGNGIHGALDLETNAMILRGKGFCLSNDLRTKGARLQRSGLFNPGGCPTKIARRGVLVVERKVMRLGRGVLVVQRKVTRRGALAADVHLKSRAAACWRWTSDQNRTPRRAGG